MLIKDFLQRKAQKHQQFQCRLEVPSADVLDTSRLGKYPRILFYYSKLEENFYRVIYF